MSNIRDLTASSPFNISEEETKPFIQAPGNANSNSNSNLNQRPNSPIGSDNSLASQSSKLSSSEYPRTIRNNISKPLLHYPASPQSTSSSSSSADQHGSNLFQNYSSTFLNQLPRSGSSSELRYFRKPPSPPQLNHQPPIHKSTSRIQPQDELTGPAKPNHIERYPSSLHGTQITEMTNPFRDQHHGQVPVQQNSKAKMKPAVTVTNNVATSSFTSNSTSSISKEKKPFTFDEYDPFAGYPPSQFPLFLTEAEDDDDAHDPEKNLRITWRETFKYCDRRFLREVFGLLLLFIVFLGIFVLLPVLEFSGALSKFNWGKDTTIRYEILSDYEYPTLGAIRMSLVDPDTPESARTKVSRTGETWDLVFSDEFNAEGRTFYEGDDQFWTAPDLHYDATKDIEWYDPDAVSTEEGVLKIQLDAFKSHNMFYRSGMLQSWNKLCFTQGKLEVSARLPHYGNVSGLWPGIWTLGNLARPGYLATSDGVWPYSYDSCDAGITANQSSPDGISYLKGQKLNACTCDGEDHPNQGTGRGAPEIDALEGATDTVLKLGVASQSYQVAPYDIWYMPDYEFIEVYDTSVTAMNTYTGGPFQQAISGVSTLNTDWYQKSAGVDHMFQKYGFEYENGDDDGYCTWFTGDNATFTLNAQALHPNGNIGWRRISKEPMSVIINLGISNNWAYIDWPSMSFPAIMEVDYVRIYQPADKVSLTCDPIDFPTTEYINRHKNAYSNVNLTSWEGAGYQFPKNALTGKCSSSKFQASS
ncbi:hypothetical protein WICPIJ_009440 [Wickerhamomyces pijperi]|uniref:GH16 domain-containing protein n=1 Tax=Wickerhamomyces pijperi TaxID=599730 RepID=A0A9P8TDT4_WICPI|nr:hypothetical protein WICPIJ_009440 [Wickerhamomyces pijperi]